MAPGLSTKPCEILSLEAVVFATLVTAVTTSPMTDGDGEEGEGVIVLDSVGIVVGAGL